MNYAVINADNVVENIVAWDGDTTWSPPDGYTAIQSKTAGIGWVMNNAGELLPPVIELSHDELIKLAESEKQILLLNAQQTIGLWTIQLQLGIISDENKNKLTQWVKYIEAVQAVDTSAAPNIIWPAQPEV